MRGLLLGTLCGSLGALAPAQVRIEEPLLPKDGKLAFDAARGVAVLITGDTWEWDGTDLVLRSTSTAPGIPMYHAGLGQVAVVDNSFGVRLWSGSTWSAPDRRGAPAFAPRSTFDAAYDVGRDRIVLFIGNGRQETWEWSSATGWSQAFPATSPDKDHGFTMAHDAARGRTVLFSGVATVPVFGWGTWEWDGADWTFIDDGPFLTDTVATFHGGLNRVVIYGGVDFEITNTMYSWDGTKWHAAGSGGNRPGDRWHHSLAYDSVRNALLLLGGETQFRNDAGGYTLANVSDLWSAGASGWTCELSSDPIPTRTGARIAAAPWRGEVMQFGGILPQAAIMNDTWVWDGKWWRERFSQAVPNGRYAHVLATEAARGVVLMFGGRAPAGGLPGQEFEFGDTWTWDGIAWTQVATSGPMARSDAGMAHHDGSGLTILFGGRNQGVLLGDTWAWDGNAWTQLFPAASPPAMAQHDMAYDRARGVIVLLGSGGTWEWDGASWTQRQPASSPPGVSSMAYDEFRERIVARSGNLTWEWVHDDWVQRLVVGVAPAGGGIAFDAARQRMVEVGTEGSGRTTEYFTDAVPTVAPFGASCSGGGVAPLHTAPGLPWIDGGYRLLLTGLRLANPAALLLGVSNTSAAGISLPASLSGIGATGCFLRTSSEFAVAMSASGGNASLDLSIPGDPALIGGTFFTQGIVLVPGANPAGLLFSNGLATTLGAK
jgi:hypothetical protein